MIISVLLVVVLASVAALLGGLGPLRAALRARASQRRLGKPVAATDLSAHQGERVVLRGLLDGGELTTRFGPSIVAIEDVHPDATSSRPEVLRLTSAGQSIDLVGPVQVVHGSREERARTRDGHVSVRRVSDNADVLVTGVVVRSDDGTYRAARFSLAAKGDGHWTERPIGVFAVKHARVPMAITVGVLATAALGVSVMLQRSSKTAAQALSTSSQHPTGRPTERACGQTIRGLLDRGDVFGAEAAINGCYDRRARAQALWAVGRVDEAAREFQAARSFDDSPPITLSEVEALVVSQPKDVAKGALERLRKDWYRGLPDPSQRAISCLMGESAQWQACVRPSNLELSVVPAAFGNPVSVVTDTFQFARALPRHATQARTWDDEYGDRCQKTGCRAAKPAALALFAGLAADGPRATRELVLLDQLALEYERSDEGMPRGDGISTGALLAQASFTVAAVAAWYAHDDARLARYLKLSEAHAGNTLSQHLELARTGKGVPVGDSSKWSSVDMELHGLADHEAPEAFVGRLKNLGYSNPLRLHALLAARPRVHSAMRAWVEQGFVPVCRDCGVFAMLEGAAKRREAARLVGAHDLEAKLADVSRRFGEVWLRDASRKTLWSLELLYSPE